MDNATRDLIKSEFKKLLQESTDQIDNIPISELGIDSLDFFEFIVHIDEHYGVKFNHIKLDNQLTINSFMDQLNQ